MMFCWGFLGKFQASLISNTYHACDFNVLFHWRMDIIFSKFLNMCFYTVIQQKMVAVNIAAI